MLRMITLTFCLFLVSFPLWADAPGEVVDTASGPEQEESAELEIPLMSPEPSLASTGTLCACACYGSTEPIIEFACSTTTCSALNGTGCATGGMQGLYGGCQTVPGPPCTPLN